MGEWGGTSSGTGVIGLATGVAKPVATGATIGRRRGTDIAFLE